jgi:hypothetical protein
MSKRSQKPVKAPASVPTGYGPLLAELKSRVRAAQVRAALSVNRELIALYWDIGRVILQRQQAEGWGAKVVARLAADLRAEFPEMTGFSRANLLFMRAFASAWSGTPIVLQPVRQLPEPKLGAPAKATKTPERQLQVASSGGEDSLAGVRESAAPVAQQVVAEFPAAPPEPAASLPWGHNLVLLHKLKHRETRLW